jgi:hypothetical protein
MSLEDSFSNIMNYSGSKFKDAGTNTNLTNILTNTNTYLTLLNILVSLVALLT